MKVSADCFVDEELKDFINAQKNIAMCDCTHQTAPIIDTEELEDFFVDLLYLYEPDKDGERLETCLLEDTRVFSHIEYVRAIMQDTVDRLSLGKDLTEKVSLKKEICNYECSWENLKKEVLTEYRYFSRLEDSMLKDLADMESSLSKGTFLYRARITPDDKLLWGPNDLWGPAAREAKAGRANPMGIPYLYLCTDAQTPLYEIRSSLQDRVTIGKFQVQETIRLVNLSTHISLFGLSSTQDMVSSMQRKKFFDKIGEDMSKPKRSIDSEIEYIPTQLVCEYCKRRSYDGISFHSSLNRDGINIVLFKNDKLKCLETYSEIVTKINIKSEQEIQNTH